MSELVLVLVIVLHPLNPFNSTFTFTINNFGLAFHSYQENAFTFAAVIIAINLAHLHLLMLKPKPKLELHHYFQTDFTFAFIISCLKHYQLLFDLVAMLAKSKHPIA